MYYGNPWSCMFQYGITIFTVYERIAWDGGGKSIYSCYDRALCGGDGRGFAIWRSIYSAKMYWHAINYSGNCIYEFGRNFKKEIGHIVR